MPSQKSALIILACEAEEMEVIITGDVLVRGGIQVVYAGLCGKDPVKCAKGASIMPCTSFEEAKNKKYDLVVIPGGPGSKKVAECPKFGEFLKAQFESGGLIAAICAGPTVLLSHGIMTDVVTGHSSVKDELIKGGYKFSDDRVVVSDKIITSQGPGTCFEFALKIVEILEGAEKAKSLIEPLVLKM